MNTIWDNERFKRLRQTFLTDFSAKITASCAPIPLTKQKKSRTKTHIVPPSMFSFLINQQGPQAPVQKPFKQSVITSTIQRKRSADKLETAQIVASANQSTLLHLDTLDSLLNKYTIDPELWNALTGEGSHQVTDLEKIISYVHPDALAMIKAHPKEFNDGVIFDNLPLGLQLKATPNGALALCVEETPRTAVNPLTIQLSLSKSLNTQDQRLNQELNAWFDEQLKTSTKDAVLLSMLNHDPQPPATDKVIQLLPEFTLNEAQCRGLCHLLMRTGPQGVLLCLQTLQRMKKDPAMFHEFDKIFLQSGDYYQFMSKTGQDNLDYFTQLRGSKLTWWNALVAQHQAAGSRIDFNDLFGAYRYFLTELENMGLNNLPSSCPFKSIKHMKIALERALYIIKHVNPADRLSQLMALEGLDFGPNSAYFAMRFDDFIWVSKEMSLIPQNSSNKTSLSYSITADHYYKKIADNQEPSIAETNLLFYRYLGKHKPASAREMYDGLKKQVFQASTTSSSAELAKLLYMVVMTTFGEEPDRDVANFLKALQATRDVSTTKLITALFISFKNVSADKIKLNQLTQIVTALNGLSYTPPETMLTLLPKLVGLSHANDEILTLILKRHTALKTDKNESSRFVRLINLLTSDTAWFADDELGKTQFIKILALLSDELTQDAVTTLATTLSALSPSKRNEILSQLSTINIDKSTNMSSFTLASINQMVTTMAARAEMSSDEIHLIIAGELPGIKLGEMDDEPSTFTAADCTKEFMRAFPLIKVLNEYKMLSSYTPKIISMIEESNNLSGDAFFEKLDKDEENTRKLLPFLKSFFSMDAIKSKLEDIGEAEFFEPVKLHFESGSMRCYIDIIFLDRFKSAVTRCVQRLQTGQPALDKFLTEKLNFTVDPTYSYGKAAKLYDAQFQEIQLFTNTLLKIKNRNIVDYGQCVAKLNDTTLWEQVGLSNMALLLEGLGDPVYEQLTEVLSTLSSITTPPTKDQLQAAIRDLTLLSQSKNDLGAETHKMLLKQAIKHDLTQATSFPLAALIGFKQGSMAEIDSKQADELFNSVLRIIKISPVDEPEILTALIDKTTRLISTYAKDMPNIVPFITIELNAIATAAEHREPLAAEPAPKIDEVNWWFLLTMLTTIVSAITLLWVMVCAWWNPPVTVDPEPDKRTSKALKNYNTSLNVIEKGLTRHQEVLPEITQLFTFFPFPSLNTLTSFFTGAHHADKLTTLETEKQAALTSLSEKLAKLEAFRPLMNSHDMTGQEAICAVLKEHEAQTNKAYNDALKQSIEHLKASIKSFDQDPFKEPTTDRDLQHQRAIDRVENVIHDMNHLLQNESFSDTEQHALARQFMYLNVIGTNSEYPLVVGDKRCENLATVSREELKGLSIALITALRTRPNLTPLEDETLTLQLLAVMREAYYRSTGIFPYSTQMLSVLVSLNHPENLMLQINTGEGKSTTTALLAGLQCVRGGSLDERKNKPRTQLVCTGNPTLVEQGYAETHHFFNDFLGISSSVINQVETDPINVNKLATGGITYTTVQALSFYKQREKREGKSFTQDDEGNELDIDSTFDECDSAFLDDYTQLSLVAPKVGSESTTTNPHAWIYPLVIQFAMADTAQDATLRDFIEKHESTTTSQRLQLLSIPDSKLEQWLDAAYDIMDYKEGVDFVILEEEQRKVNGIEKTMSIVTPINRSGVPQRGSSFPNYRHEMLQAKMKLHDLMKEFPIDPEVDVVDQESVKSLIDGLAHQGRMVGLSGTLGNTDELKELATTCHMHAIKIPPHQKNLRDTSMPVSLGSTGKKQDKDLELIIQQGKDQPLLVVCKTIRNVEKLYLKLSKKYPGRVQKITGKEQESDITQRKERAGLSRMITIGTPLMGRGVDFKTDYPQGFHLHQRFIDAQRETEQVMGRVARNGKAGKYSASYVIDGVPFQYGFSYFGVDATAAMKQFKEQQKKITRDAATVRHYIQAFDAIQQGTLQQFDACKKQLLETNPEAREQLEQSLSTMRTALIEKLQFTWNSNLPEGSNPNPYLNDRGELNTALKTFEKHLIPDLWKETHAALLAMDSSQDGSRLAWLADIKQTLNARKLTARREEKQATIHSQQAHQQLQSALDPAAATLFYSENTLSPQETECLINASDTTQVSYMVKDINAIIGAPKIAFDDTKPIVDNLTTVINAIAKSLNDLSIDQQYQLQATFAQAVEYWKRLTHGDSSAKLDTPIDALEQHFIERCRKAPADELEKRLVWANPDKKSMTYWLELPSVRVAADELYNLASNKDTPLSMLYQRLYHYKLLLKDELVNYNPWMHEDIRVVIDDALRHIKELKRIEPSNNESSFQQARDEALYAVYFKRFNAQVEQISATYSLREEWKPIAEKIKSIQKQNPSLSVLHELKHYLNQHATLQLTPPNNYSYFFNSAPDLPVKDLLKRLEACQCNIQQDVPEFSSDKQYLATKASVLTTLMQEADMGAVKSLTITPKYSGVGEYFELRIEGAEKPKSFELDDDVVRYTPNIPQLKAEIARLKLQFSVLQRKNRDNSNLLTELDSLEPANTKLLESSLTEHTPAINKLNEAIQSWLTEKANTWFSSLWSLADKYPFSPEITQQKNDLDALVRQAKEDVTQQINRLQKDIGFLTKTIEENERVDETVIIKKFQSIDELLTYEDSLIERVRLHNEQKQAGADHGPRA